jgi:hypothetical protein
VKLIEEHAEQITQGLLKDIQTNPKTSSYQRFSVDEMYSRAYTVYKNLGEWLVDKKGAEAQKRYLDLGRRRFEEKIPVSHVIFALVLTRNHLLKYINMFGLVDTALELHRELELFSTTVSQTYCAGEALVTPWTYARPSCSPPAPFSGLPGFSGPGA